MRNSIAFASLVACLGMCQPSQAALILQDQWSSVTQMEILEPLGQVFTAEDPVIHSIGLFIRDFNPQFADRSMVVSLRQGAGTSGPAGWSAFAQPAAGTDGWVDFFVGSNIPLVVGNQYTIEINVVNPRWGIYNNQHTFTTGVPIPGRIDYIGGDAVFDGALNSLHDLRFRVVPVTAQAAVPEPTSLTMFGLGALGLVGATVRRRKRAF